MSPDGHPELRAVIASVVEAIPATSPVVTSLGSSCAFASQLRPGVLAMDAMGLAVGVGVGLSLAVDHEVYVLETDGSLLLDLSCLALMGELKNQDRLSTRTLVFDNLGYESAGGSRRPAPQLDWHNLIAAFGLSVAVRSFDEGVPPEPAQWWQDDVCVLRTPMASPDDTPGTLTGRERVVEFRSFLQRSHLITLPLPATKN